MNNEEKEPQPLAGIRVLDFTQGVAGPHCTMLMALNGAHVTKIEPLAGDWIRALGQRYGDQSAHSVAFNRAKKSLAVDLKHPQVAGIMKSMIAQADVVVESFRPGVMGRFGLDYESFREQQPALVYGSVTGFGQSGPNKDLPVTDAVIQAYTGWMDMNQGRDGMPQKTNMVAIDVMTGLYAYQAVSTALLARFRFGKGRYIECSLMQSAAAFQSAKIIEHHLEAGAAQSLHVPIGAFHTADGIINISTLHDRHFAALCQVLDRTDMLTDSRYLSVPDRQANADELLAEIQVIFLTRTARDWSAALSAGGVINSEVLDYQRFLQTPHVQQTRAFDWVDAKGVGQLPLPKIPGCGSGDEHPDNLVSPLIGQHSRELLAEHQVSAETIDSLIEQGAVGAAD